MDDIEYIDDDIEYTRITDSMIERIVEWLESNGIHKGIEEEIREGTTDGYYIYLDDMTIQVTKNNGKAIVNSEAITLINKIIPPIIELIKAICICLAIEVLFIAFSFKVLASL